MNRNYFIAAAVTAALSSAAASAAAPGLTTVKAVPAAQTVYIAGSSAIKAALLTTIQTTFCGGVFTNITPTSNTGDNTNFLGVSCTPNPSFVSGTNSGKVMNVFLRYEGGSVTGYLPVVNGKSVNMISASALTTLTPTFTGESTTNGVDDSFGGPLAPAQVDLGIGDVEPQALIVNNYPSAYSTTVWGPNNQTGMFALNGAGVVDEVYGIFVNTGSVAGSTLSTTLNLTQETLSNILSGAIKNWNQVFDTSGHVVASASVPITVVNREIGSGSRAATDILMVGDSCSGTGRSVTLKEGGTPQDYFSTGDVLSANDLVAGGITYATIDNVPLTPGKHTANQVLVNINGVTPSNLNAALGIYPFWVEAEWVDNTGTTGHDDTAVRSIVSAMQAQGTTGSLADINVIPSVVNAAGTPAKLNTVVHANAAASLSNGVYVNPYTRKGVTCSAPVVSANTFP